MDNAGSKYSQATPRQKYTQVKFPMNCPVAYTGLNFGTSPKSRHVDDTGSSPVRTKIFIGYPMAKAHIYVKFPINCRVAQCPRALGDGHWPQICDLPKIPPHGQHGFESCTCWNIHKNWTLTSCQLHMVPSGWAFQHWKLSSVVFVKVTVICN